MGCAKNMVDSERLLAATRRLGFRPTEDPSLADLLVVNTCAFILPAATEAVDVILDVAVRRKPGARLAVVGCLASRYGEELAKNLPEADLVMPPKDYRGFVSAVGAFFSESPARAAGVVCGGVSGDALSGVSGDVLNGVSGAGALFPGDFETWERDRGGTPPWRAWLKIAEGCDNSCAYCLIPRLRGRLKVRPLSELAAEAESLARSGVRELTLVAQDLTAWREGKNNLADLVERLGEIEGLVWIRLMYAYPERLGKKLVKRLAAVPKVAAYLDVPVQHASPDVLGAMGREAAAPLPLVENLREWWPGVALRTTLMVGFPGETERDYQLLREFMERARFDQAGVFVFSPEEGTRAALMPGRVPGGVGRSRRRGLMSLQKKISLAANKARVGREVLVLVEGPSADSDLVMTGRADFQAPEVDGLIIFDGHQPLPGRMVRARLLKAGPYDLAASFDPDGPAVTG
ncbi:MAG: 30S ribosomal protein S12 methylthiotransferase RimO [Deltaproteobacteria bacterium]|nr:30S ribosomal protein S12 methylthiotransferase RimO [Deltaproteobacteria bacterium]